VLKASSTDRYYRTQPYWQDSDIDVERPQLRRVAP